MPKLSEVHTVRVLVSAPRSEQNTASDQIKDDIQISKKAKGKKASRTPHDEMI